MIEALSVNSALFHMIPYLLFLYETSFNSLKSYLLRFGLEGGKEESVSSHVPDDMFCILMLSVHVH